MGLPEKFLQSIKRCNYNIALIKKAKVPHLYVESNRILSFYSQPGLEITTQTSPYRVKIKMLVKKNVKMEKPIFLCFGIFKEKGKQIIIPEIILEEDSQAKILTNCIFPQAKDIIHKMHAEIKLRKNAKLTYQERHYHGENFGAEVLPSFKVLVDKNASFKNEFILTEGSIGRLKVFFETELKQNASCEILNKIIGKGRKDEVEIYDRILLNGKNSSSLNKIKGVAINGGKILFKGETEAGKKAKNARGHIDCQEIIVGRSIAQSIPVVTVKNPEARITHEASVGKVNQKQLETLMTRGLTESQAIDFIIRGKI